MKGRKEEEEEKKEKEKEEHILPLIIGLSHLIQRNLMIVMKIIIGKKIGKKPKKQ